MFKIGDFAKLCRVSVKALHHYEELGLLKPARVDRFNGYRYYSMEQLPKLNRILALKDLGFSLEQVRRLVNEPLSVEELRGMLKLRLSELHEEKRLAQERLERVAARLRIIEEEGKMSDYEVLLKQVEPIRIVSSREVVATAEEMREHCMALMDEVSHVMKEGQIKDAGPSLALYHDSANGIDVEMAMVVPPEANPSAQGRVQIYDLPPVPVMASIVYQGSYDDFAAVSKIYAALGKWIEINSYQITGPSRELYLQVPQLGTGDPSGIMEIQFPVEKII